MTRTREPEQQPAPVETAPASAQSQGAPSDVIRALSGTAGNRAVARMLAPRPLQRQPTVTSPDAGTAAPADAGPPAPTRDQKLAAFRDHVANARWTDAVLQLNDFSLDDIEREVKKVAHEARALLYKHTLVDMFDWTPPRVRDQIKKVDAAAAVLGRKWFFHHARTKADWKQIAIALDGFDKDSDIVEMVGWLLRQELVPLRDAAIAAGSPARVLTAVRDQVRIKVADEMGGPEMFGKSAKWVPSGGKAGRPSGVAPDDFAAWAEAPTESAAPKIDPATTINCWEMVLLAAYRSGALTWKWIHDLYVAAPAGGWGAELVKALTPSGRKVYDRVRKAPRPQRGEIVLFNGPAHVALATGTRTAAGLDEVYTFWPPTSIAVYTRGTVDKVKTDTIEGLADFIDRNFSACTVEVGAPPW